MLVRCAREAISGTTPPNTRWMSWDRITSDFCTTSSPLPSSTAADVSSQDVSIPKILVIAVGFPRPASPVPRPSFRPLGQQPVHQRPRVRRIPVGRAHQLLPNDAVLADDERLGISGDVVGLGDLSLSVVKDLEREPVLSGEGADRRLGARIIDADSYDLQPLWGVVLVQRFDARHLHPARQAPRRPDVQHQYLATIIGESLFLWSRRVEGVRGELRCLASELDGEELVTEIMGRTVRDGGDNADDKCGNRQLLPTRHACAVQRLRSSAISAWGFFAAKMALPA